MTVHSPARFDVIDDELLEEAEGRRFSRAIGPAVALVAWIFVYLVGLLGLWVALVSSATGWHPVVITSGSMSPVLRVGDVILIEDHPDELLGQRSVITFERDGEVITHRIFEVEASQETYVTKGDANPTPDTDRVPADAVIGVARLVVPLIGLPLVWYQTGQTVPLAAMGILSLAALAFGGGRTRQGLGGFRSTIMDGTSGVADQAVRRVRLLIAVMIASQYIIDSSRLAIDGLEVSPTTLLVLSLAWLGATNFVSIRFPVDSYGWLVSVGQLLADTVLVVFLTTATGGSGIGWVLTAVPIIEAAVRFRLAGALVHWMLMAIAAILGRLWMLGRIASSTVSTIDELEQLLDQMSVLLLVIVPGAFLAEQLMGDVLVQRRATMEALDRGRLLENVAEVGHEVTKIGSALFETLTVSAVELGFDSVDVWTRRRDGTWALIGQAGNDATLALPQPGATGSGLRYIDLVYAEVLVDQRDHDDAEWEALEENGLSYLLRITLASGETMVVLRGAGASGTELDGDKVEALRLLCGQAAVAIHNQDLVGELQQLHSQLEHQALHDALTELPNRSFFLRELNRELLPEARAALDPGRNKWVLFLDLDGFKPVNDQLGHDVGDELLREVARQLVDVVGTSGLVARLGGDEFTILLPDADKAMANETAAAVHRSLSAPITLGPDIVQVGSSIGIAAYEPGVDTSELLRRADTAMYAAKQSRGRLAHYDPSLDEADVARQRLIEDFERALASNGLSLVYQPLVSVPRRMIVGAEVLLRWDHPELGRLSPELVLETAERADRVGDLNRWIIDNALRDLGSLQLADDDDFTLAVNASPAELESAELIPNLRRALAETGLPPQRLIVELSERIVAAGDDLSDIIAQLMELGIVLSLDDFGEGKTSLGHLRRLPVRQLKLDRELVRQACNNEIDRIIFRSVVELGHGLGLEVVAEGVETADQMRTVVQAGAELVQGYGLFRPMGVDRLAQLLRVEGRSVIADRLGLNMAPVPTATAAARIEPPAVAAGQEPTWPDP